MKKTAVCVGDQARYENSLINILCILQSSSIYFHGLVYFLFCSRQNVQPQVPYTRWIFVNGRQLTAFFINDIKWNIPTRYCAACKNYFNHFYNWKFYIGRCPMSGFNVRAWLDVHWHSSALIFADMSASALSFCNLIKWLVSHESIFWEL